MAKEISKLQIKKAATQISSLQKQVDYDTRDYPIDYLVENYKKGEFIEPAYQRNASVWDQHRKERFIESLILGYPIPLLFLSDTTEGKLEIVDGLQRISTLNEFMHNDLVLKRLDKLTSLEGFCFKELPDDEKRRLSYSSLRVIVLRKNTDKETRIDLFNRLNTSLLKANDAEIRNGSQQLNPVMKLIEKLSKNAVFQKLINLSTTKSERKEDAELAARFFAYSHNYENFSHNVNTFVDNFVTDYEKNYNSGQKKILTDEFITTFKFIDENYPTNIFKNSRNQTPRVRFEAISVGTNLALKTKPELEVTQQQIREMISSKEFKQLTTSDGSNSRPKVVKRINFVRDYLLSETKLES